MTHRIRCGLGSAVFLLPCVMAAAQTSYPMLMSLHPVAAQQGQTSEHQLESRYSLEGATQVLISGSGVQGEIVALEGPSAEAAAKKGWQSIKVRLVVAPDAPAGVRDFRVVTPRGASTVGQLVVTPFPVVSESSSNDEADQAQVVPVPVAACGILEKGEDVDFYRFTAAAGAELSFHVHGMRLEDRIHDLQEHADPILTLRNAHGTTLASSDNYFAGDPWLGYRFSDAGDYLLEIRDVRYKGNKYWVYCVEISDRPFVENVFPPAMHADQPQPLELAGFLTPASVTARLPGDTPLGVTWLAAPRVADFGTPAPVLVTDLPVLAEEADAPADAEHGQPISVPCVVNGRIAAEHDVDCYVLDAKKGDSFTIEILARRLQSRLDSHLRVLNLQGRQLALNDDLRNGQRTSPDSRIDNWTAPADGRYAIEVRDLNLRGGPAFPYALRITPGAPAFALYLDTDKTNLAPGACGVIFVRAERKNGFQGEVTLSAEGLPAGVTAHCGRILPPPSQDGCIVLEAAPDAPVGAANITVIGSATHTVGNQTRTLHATAVPYEEIYQPGGGRGHWPVDMHTVCVGAPGDVRAVTLDSYDITLHPGESKKIQVKIERAEGFDKDVMLDVAMRHLNTVYGSALPTGVTVDTKDSKTLLSGKEIEGTVTLKAAADAPPAAGQLIAVTANVSINFVMKWCYGSKPLRISVAK